MDVKHAIAKAKSYLAVAFSDEEISEIRLEEVEFDREESAWLITLGLLRPSLSDRKGQLAMLGPGPLKRSYKTVKIPDDETDHPSIKIREFGEI